jgi:hypothetical protein
MIFGSLERVLKQMSEEPIYITEIKMSFVINRPIIRASNIVINKPLSDVQINADLISTSGKIIITAKNITINGALIQGAEGTCIQCVAINMTAAAVGAYAEQTFTPMKK